MAKYRVLQPSFINDMLVEPGEIVEIDFEKGANIGANLELVKEAKGKKGGDAPEAPDAAEAGADLV